MSETIVSYKSQVVGSKGSLISERIFSLVPSSKISSAKPDPFLWLNPILDPKFELSRVGLALGVKKLVGLA